MEGRVEAIRVAAAAGAPMETREEIRATAGGGLAGDRYGTGDRAPSGASNDHGLTLIEAEALEAVARDEKLALSHADTRRNLLTRGVALNHLVGREFRVGTVRARGLELCEPCRNLERDGRRGVVRALLHRGGLRAEILSDGEIRVGDPVSGD